VEAKGKAWMAASAGMLALAILTTAAPMISGAISNRSFTEPYGTIPAQGSCTDKLSVYVLSLRDINLIFNKNIRTYFEQQTQCVVEKTPYRDSSGGNYANQHFPDIADFEYTILSAEPYQIGGSFGSIPAWKVRVRYEVEFEALPGWGLCSPASQNSAIFSGDWQDPDWPAGDAIKWLRSNWWYNEYWAPRYGQDTQYWSRYSVSSEKELTVTDQYGPIIEVGAYLCGSDPIFQNSTGTGLHYVGGYYYLNPADLKPYNIPFYAWMGW